MIKKTLAGIGVFLDADLVYRGHLIVSEATGGVRVFDVTDPALPVEVEGCEAPRHVVEAAPFGDYVVVANSWGGISVLDLGIPLRHERPFDRP